MPTIIITTSQTFSRPVDWDDNNNSIQCIGGGSGGRSWVNGPHGGGGGAFAKSVNVVIAASNSITIGAGGTPDNPGSNTSFGSFVIAAGGNIITGGSAGSCVYNNVAFSGGNGGTWSGGIRTGGCGGGGAAGTFGAGAQGQSDGGGDAGGNGGNSQSAVGGAGGNNAAGGNGNNGTEYSPSYGAGAGGGGGADSVLGGGFGPGFNGGHGGFYGGAGGGGGYGASGSGSGGYGRSGLVVITWTPLVPIISNVTPAVGTILGGTSVTINGVGFIGVSSVTFGGVSATSINVVSPNVITCVTPAHAQGLVSVVVTGTNGVGSSNAFRYVLYTFPTVGNVILSGSAPAVTSEVDTTGQIRLSSTSPTIVNTTFRNITPDHREIVLSSVKPRIDQTHDLVLSTTIPFLDVTTIPVAKVIYDDDSDDDVIIIYLDEVTN